MEKTIRIFGFILGLTGMCLYAIGNNITGTWANSFKYFGLVGIGFFVFFILIQLISARQEAQAKAD
jgi:hypothetical protein